MTSTQTRVRSVLDAPRGCRFTRTPAPPAPRRSGLVPETRQEREQRLLRQMAGNPRVAHRLEHGAIPEWMIVDQERREHAEHKARQAKKYEATETDPFPPRQRRGRHRAPRRSGDWVAATLTYGMALATGMVVSHVAALLM